ncbi:UbiA-like protein EboC [Parafilimonas sp.]|uniref:UbiA-like protein EboC n=1 Tax=Parafilimonas sp. TaxID=1969739 RepID=UPI0039E2BEC1
MKKTKAFLQLMRPANIITAVSDVLAGAAISGVLFYPSPGTNEWQHIILLCISTIGLYGGGIVLNDVFDAELDKAERPERAIPQGYVQINEAAALGIILLFIGITAAFFCSIYSGIIACSIAIAAVLYDKWGKHNPVTGPVNMGLCRGLNLLLGISIVTSQLIQWWALAFIPMVYIASITMISRGDVHGGNKNLLYAASLLYILVTGSILYFAIANKTGIYLTAIFLLLFAWTIFAPLVKAIQQPAGKNIGRAVKAGVIGLILMNASWASAFNATYFAIIIALLLPISIGLGKVFAVT